jgi:hypothetical protein
MEDIVKYGPDALERLTRDVPVVAISGPLALELDLYRIAARALLDCERAHVEITERSSKEVELARVSWRDALDAFNKALLDC